MGSSGQHMTMTRDRLLALRDAFLKKDEGNFVDRFDKIFIPAMLHKPRVTFTLQNCNYSFLQIKEKLNATSELLTKLKPLILQNQALHKEIKSIVEHVRTSRHTVHQLQERQQHWMYRLFVPRYTREQHQNTIVRIETQTLPQLYTRLTETDHAYRVNGRLIRTKQLEISEIINDVYSNTNLSILEMFTDFLVKKSIFEILAEDSEKGYSGLIYVTILLIKFIREPKGLSEEDKNTIKNIVAKYLVHAERIAESMTRNI